MNKSNLSSQESSLSDLSLEAKDSPTMDIGYFNFINMYKQACDDRLTNAEQLEGANRQWAQLTEEQRMQFVPEKSNASLSVKSISGGQLLEGVAPTATAISAAAFNNFMETYTIRLSQKAAKRWEGMTKSERAAYAAKDDGAGSPSASSNLDCENEQEPQSPQLANDMFGTVGQESCCPKKRARRCKPKPRCRKPKPRCCKPKPRCCKPKPRCPKPKPRCCKPKPRCRKPKPPCMR